MKKLLLLSVVPLLFFSCSEEGSEILEDTDAAFVAVADDERIYDKGDEVVSPYVFEAPVQGQGQNKSLSVYTDAGRVCIDGQWFNTVIIGN